MAKKEQKHDVQITKFTRSLPVKLTEEELLARGDRAAYLDRREEELTAALNSAKSDYKHQIEAVIAERRALQERIRSKQEHREVECEQRMMYRLGKVIEIRIDTGEQISERPMLESERQLPTPEVPTSLYDDMLQSVRERQPVTTDELFVAIDADPGVMQAVLRLLKRNNAICSEAIGGVETWSVTEP